MLSTGADYTTNGPLIGAIAYVPFNSSPYHTTVTDKLSSYLQTGTFTP